MRMATALKTLFLSLAIAGPGSVLADTRGAGAAALKSVDIVAMFDATCGSGRTTAASLRESFEAQGFATDGGQDTYGYFTRAGVAANYHIYPGSWTCFVSAQIAAAPDLCEALAARDGQAHARLPDGTCVFTMPAHGLTVVVRDICPDASQGACTWVQATRTTDRDCHAAEGVDLASLSESFVNPI